MADEKIELRKIRDFSEILNDTFVFIKQNLRPLLTCFIGISGIFMLASAILNGIYQGEVGGILQKIFTGRGTDNAGESFSFFTSTYIFVPILAWVNVMAMKVSLIAYMKVYEDKQKQTPTFAEVWHVFSKYYLKVFFYSIPVLIVIILGSVLCIAPGVYLAVVFVPFEMILIAEAETFGGAWDRCFRLIKENFWVSLGVYIVAYLIYIVSSYIVGGIMSLIAGGLTYFSTRDFSTTIGLATSILNIFSFIFFIVYYVAAILNYFSLVEKYEGTGIIKRLDDLGNTPTQNIEEEY